MYKTTFERHVDQMERADVYRESMIQFAKDASRSVDYLETRSDIQTRKLGYYGMSLGGDLGPVLMALDSRFESRACSRAVGYTTREWLRKSTL